MPLDLDIFSPSTMEVVAVEPVPDERLFEIGLGLGDFILVMGEDIVHAAAMDVEGRPEKGRAHGRIRCASPAGPARISVSQKGSPSPWGLSTRRNRGRSRTGLLQPGVDPDVVRRASTSIPESRPQEGNLEMSK